MRRTAVTRQVIAFLVLVCATLAWGEPEAPAEPKSPAEPEAPAEPAGEETESTLEQRVQEILETPADDGGYGEAVRCIRSLDYQRVEILDSRRLVFHGRGDKRWLNQLRISCPGLRRNDTLSFEIRTNRVCAMDTFRSVDLTGFGGYRSGSCSLGKFEPITPEQVQMLEDALRAERAARRKSKD